MIYHAILLVMSVRLWYSWHHDSWICKWFRVILKFSSTFSLNSLHLLPVLFSFLVFLCIFLFMHMTIYLWYPYVYLHICRSVYLFYWQYIYRYACICMYLYIATHINMIRDALCDLQKFWLHEAECLIPAVPTSPDFTRAWQRCDLRVLDWPWRAEGLHRASQPFLDGQKTRQGNADARGPPDGCVWPGSQNSYFIVLYSKIIFCTSFIWCNMHAFVPDPSKKVYESLHRSEASFFFLFTFLNPVKLNSESRTK